MPIGPGPGIIPVPPFNPAEIPGPIWPVQIVFAILEFLAQLLGFGSGSTELFTRAINNTWANFMLTSGFLYNAIGLFRDFALKLLNIVFDGLHHIISDILHGHLLQALQDIQKLFHDLHNLFAPLILWLRQLQRIQRAYQLQALRRIINLIQRARQFLVILKLLHVKWAQRLDSWLLQVEGKLISHVYALFRKENEVIGWINWALDPVAMIRATPYFGTFARGMKAVWGAAQAIGIYKLFPQLARGSGPRGPVVSHAQFYGGSHFGAPGGDGYFGEAQRSVLALRDRMRGELGGLQG